MRRIPKLPLNWGLLVAVIILLLPPAWAVDGVLEINQTCAAGPGCFPGDSAGLPVTIGSSGSYRLTGNLTATGGPIPVIDISADAVTVDLNGFSIQGAVSCVFDVTLKTVTCTPPNNGSAHGILGQGDDITVLNGTISGMGSFGIILLNATSFRVDGVHVTSNAGVGIAVGNNSIVSNCTVALNGLDGIRSLSLGGNSTFDRNTVYQNGGVGLFIGDAGVVTRNTSSQNS